MQDVSSSPRIIEGAVGGGDSGAEVRRQGGEFAVAHLVSMQDHSCKARGVEHAIPAPRLIVQCARALEKANVIWGVVRDEDRIAGELQEGRQSRAQARGGRDRGIRDAGE